MRPMRISSHSARATTLCQSEEPSPIETFPNSWAEGATQTYLDFNAFEQTVAGIKRALEARADIVRFVLGEYKHDQAGKEVH